MTYWCAEGVEFVFMESKHIYPNKYKHDGGSQNYYCSSMANAMMIGHFFAKGCIEFEV